MLFVNAKKCLSLSFLKYREEIFFRGQASTLAIEHACMTLHADEDTDGKVTVDFRMLPKCSFLLHRFEGVENLGLHMSLVIDDEINDTSFGKIYTTTLYNSTQWGFSFAQAGWRGP